jgi:hypothetical protein
LFIDKLFLVASPFQRDRGRVRVSENGAGLELLTFVLSPSPGER